MSIPMNLEILEQKLLEKHGGLVWLAPGQEYKKMIEPMKFIDRDYGEWENSPNNVLNKGCVHPQRRLEKRKATMLERYGVDNPFKDVAKMQRGMLAKYGGDHPTRVTALVDAKTERYLTAHGVENPLQNLEVREKIKSKNLEKFGCVSPLGSEEVRTKGKQTLLERYGVDNPLKNEEVKKRVQATNMDRYGGIAPAASTEVREKMKKTMAARYGAEYVMLSPELRNRIEATNQDRYGVPNPFCLPEVQDRIRTTNQKLYGVPHPCQNSEVLKKLKRTNLEKHGVEFIGELTFRNHTPTREKIRGVMEDQHGWAFCSIPDGTSLGDYLRKHGREKDLNYSSCKHVLLTHGFDTLKQYVEGGKAFSIELTSLELKTSKLLGLEKCTDVLSNRNKPDFKLSETLYLDADSLFHHSRQPDKEYHHKKRIRYESLGLRLLQFRETELSSTSSIVLAMIDTLLGKSRKIGARELEVREIPWAEASDFLMSNHLQGKGSPAKSFGLCRGDELFQVMSVRKKGSGLEIARLCSKNGLVVAGGFSRLLSQVRKLYGPLVIESWCDLRYANGKGYEKVGFKKVRDVLGWSWTDLKKVYNRLYCRANMDERGLTEKEHAAELKLYRLYDAGQRLYRLDP